MDCRRLSKQVSQLAGLPPTDVPDDVRRHVSGCPACARALAAERATRALLRSLAEPGQAPPPGFAERVLASLPVRTGQAQPDAWRPAWQLMPAFAAALVLLVVAYGASLPAVPAGLLPLEDLTAGEWLVLQDASPSPDLVLSAIMEETR